jgi:signal transduction histidine kinase
MVYGIVKNHHGLIDVESELQRGTKFRIYLPVAAARQEIIAA